MATLARIDIYPIKSFDAQGVAEANLLPGGALEHDRRYALRDPQGDLVNGKRFPAVHKLRLLFDPIGGRLTLRAADEADESAFHIDRDRSALADWLGAYFGTPLEIIEDAAGGFPDDTESPGPTVVSTATLEEVGRWFGLGLDETRARFRANLEIGGVEPFWEDRLVSDEGRVVRFRIGSVELLGANPCQRCPVPTRNPWTGAATSGFARHFAQQRAAGLPAWAPRSRFDHFYRLAVNTRGIGGTVQRLRVGDAVSVLGVE